MHVDMDTYNFGSPKVIDTGKTELGLRQWVKNPSLTAPKRGAERYTEGLARWLSNGLALKTTLQVGYQANDSSVVALVIIHHSPAAVLAVAAVFLLQSTVVGKKV